MSLFRLSGADLKSLIRVNKDIATMLGVTLAPLYFKLKGMKNIREYIGADIHFIQVGQLDDVVDTCVLDHLAFSKVKVLSLSIDGGKCALHKLVNVVELRFTARSVTWNNTNTLPPNLQKLTFKEYIRQSSALSIPQTVTHLDLKDNFLNLSALSLPVLTRLEASISMDAFPMLPRTLRNLTLTNSHREPCVLNSLPEDLEYMELSRFTHLEFQKDMKFPPRLRDLVLNGGTLKMHDFPKQLYGFYLKATQWENIDLDLTKNHSLKKLRLCLDSRFEGVIKIPPLSSLNANLHGARALHGTLDVASMNYLQVDYNKEDFNIEFEDPSFVERYKSEDINVHIYYNKSMVGTSFIFN